MIKQKFVFSKKNRRRKIKNCKSSETRFKFRADSSHVQRENGCSKFASAEFAKRKQFGDVVRLKGASGAGGLRPSGRQLGMIHCMWL